MKKMKRILIAIVSSIVIYGALLFVSSATGSGILSSGPLDWLFNALVSPGFYLAERLELKSELMIVAMCWLTYVPIIGVTVYGLISFATRKRSNANA